MPEICKTDLFPEWNTLGRDEYTSIFGRSIKDNTVDIVILHRFMEGDTPSEEDHWLAVKGRYDCGEIVSKRDMYKDRMKDMRSAWPEANITGTKMEDIAIADMLVEGGDGQQWSWEDREVAEREICWYWDSYERQHREWKRRGYYDIIPSS